MSRILEIIFVVIESSSALIEGEVAVKALEELLDELVVGDFRLIDEVKPFGISNIKFIKDEFDQFQGQIDFSCYKVRI
jgi:hypothetical protein